VIDVATDGKAQQALVGPAQTRFVLLADRPFVIRETGPNILTFIVLKYDFQIPGV
jgi:hypothetical protein